MKKYSYDLKIRIVKEYQDSHLTVESLAEKYGIPSTNSISTWISIYKTFGKDGLKESADQPIYPVQFKKDVLHYMKRTGSSYQATANTFGIRYGSTVRSWNLIVQEQGMEGLTETKGASPMAKKEKQVKKRKPSKKTANPSINAGRMAELERENELLRLENSYLKKLEAFQEKQPPEKHKPKLRSLLNKKDLN